MVKQQLLEQVYFECRWLTSPGGKMEWIRHCCGTDDVDDVIHAAVILSVERGLYAPGKSPKEIAKQALLIAWRESRSALHLWGEYTDDVGENRRLDQMRDEVYPGKEMRTAYHPIRYTHPISVCESSHTVPIEDDEWVYIRRTGSVSVWASRR